MFFDEFTKSQLTSWPLARNNYERLRNVIYRTIDFEGFQIRIQHNPDRIQSAVAKIDEQSIRARACFLCKGNIPPEQASFDYNPTLDIRVNPYSTAITQFRQNTTFPSSSRDISKTCWPLHKLIRSTRSFIMVPVAEPPPRIIFISNWQPVTSCP